MKLTNKLFFVATAALVAFACTKEIDSPQTGAIGKTYIDVTDGLI